MTITTSGRKIRRNEPCPCGSGLKFKKCHGAPTGDFVTPIHAAHPRHLALALKSVESRIRQREAQQGLGRPIISVEYDGSRFVAVRNKLLYSKNWKTFHDFLFDYIRHVLGGEWGNAELKKPLEQRHPILQWYNHLCDTQQRSKKNKNGIYSSLITGAIAAYLRLAYHLYLLAHNVSLQTILINRLKNIASFHGAYYEVFVAASFIKAGFDVELENERDGSTTHCEFTAISRTSGKKYSVEAKARHVPGVLGAHDAGGTRDRERVKIGHQLHKALTKHANHPRVVFIDVNVPDRMGGSEEVIWLKDVLSTIREKEESLTVGGVPAPEAYVFATNHPYHHFPDELNFRVAVVAEGFKIPDFKVEIQFASLHEALLARERHADMFHLMRSLEDQSVPSTFNGEIPEYVFGDIEEPRLLIGGKYVVPEENGEEAMGELTDAVVMEAEKKVYCVMSLSDGRNVIVSCPLSDRELEAYKRHPDTFFGVYKRVHREVKDALELYDFFYGVYRATPKERLLEFLASAPDRDMLERLSQEELAKVFCERSASAAMWMATRKTVRADGGSR